MIRARSLASMLVLAMFAPAAPAAAGTVGIEDWASGKVLHYVAAPGEFNELSIMLQGGRFTIQDGTGGQRDTLAVTAKPPCEHDTTPQPSPGLIDAYCPPDGVTTLAVELSDANDAATIGGVAPTDVPAVVDGGDGADRVHGGPQGDHLHGGPGNDTLTGAGGRDVLWGGEGDDTLAVGDGAPDRVSCGAGFDVVTADLIDTAADDCELVEIGPGQPQRIELRVPAAPPLAGIAAHGLRASLTCPGTCSARSSLLIAAGRSSGARAAGLGASRVVGTGRASRRGGGRLSVVTRLRPGALRRLRRLGRPRLTLRLTVQVGDAATTIVQRAIRPR